MRALVDINRFFSTHPLTRRNRLAAWSRFAVWQIRSRLQDEVIVPWVCGQSLAVRHGMTGATGNIYVGLHEFTDMLFVLSFLRPGDLFLDIGANVGSYSVLAAGACGATSWAFEPDPETARHFMRNMTLNGLEERVRLHQCALGGYKGVVAFTVGLDTVNRVAGDETRAVRQVPQDTLDGVVGNARPIMLKIDVEGYEEAVLSAAGAVLAEPSLRAIAIETVTDEMDKILVNHGFSRSYYDPYEHRIASRPIEDSHNYLYIRDVDFVNRRLLSSGKISVLGKNI